MPACPDVFGVRKVSSSPTQLPDVPKQRDGRFHFARVKVRREGDTFYASTTGPQGSGIIVSMAEGEGFIVVPPGDGVLPKGSRVRLILFEESSLRMDAMPPVE